MASGRADMEGDRRATERGRCHSSARRSVEFHAIFNPGSVSAGPLKEQLAPAEVGSGDQHGILQALGVSKFGALQGRIHQFLNVGESRF